MKFLAVLKRSSNFDMQKAEPLFEEEGITTKRLYAEHKAREVYSRSDGKGAVAVLEANSEEDTLKILSQLPFMREKIIDATVYGLNPHRVFIG